MIDLFPNNCKYRVLLVRYFKIFDVDNIYLYIACKPLPAFYNSDAMLYFTQTNLDNYATDDVENAIRHFSSKRHASLDIKSSSSSIGEHKYFLGLESNSDLKITRIRTPFEGYFPKVIVRFPKDGQFKIFKIRYSILSIIIFCILLFALLQSMYSIIIYKEFENDFVGLAIIFGIFLILTFFEIKLTKRKIERAIKNYTREIEGKNGSITTD